MNLTRIEAARYLRHSVRWLDKRRHKIGFYREGRNVWYKQEDLDAWLERHKVGGSSGGAASRMYASRTRRNVTRSARAREIENWLLTSPPESTRT